MQPKTMSGGYFGCEDHPPSLTTTKYELKLFVVAIVETNKDASDGVEVADVDNFIQTLRQINEIQLEERSSPVLYVCCAMETLGFAVGLATGKEESLRKAIGGIQLHSLGILNIAAECVLVDAVAELVC